MAFPPRCGPSANEHSRELLAYVKNLVSSPRLTRARESLGISQIDSSTVTLVTSDSVCRQAARLLNLDQGKPEDHPLTMYVVKFGSRYWAESPSVKGGEYLKAFILNADLSEVLKTTAR